MLTPLDQARAHVLERLRGPLPRVELSVPEAVGLVAATEVLAHEQQPPFDNSAMDGFAVRSSDTQLVPATLRVVATTLAGESGTDQPLGAGESVRIMTGAPVPAGADAVVPIEQVEVLDDGATVRIKEAVEAGKHIRRAGDDVSPGAVVLPAGVAITAAHVGLLLGLGVDRVSVHRRPKVGVVSTGDELVEGSDPLLPGQIRDSNRPALLAAVAATGAEPVDLGIAPDNADAITRVLMRGVTECDAVVTTGGVSMGDVDLVRVVLDVLGELRWMQVAIKPAKPFAFGVVDGVPVFGLPGNPVSSLVSFELFARPAIRRLAGHPLDRLDRPCPVAIAPEGLPRRPDGKLHFVRVAARVRADGHYEVRSAGGQGSHQLSAMAAANGLAIVPDGPGIEPGGTVDVLLLGET